ncbi:nucleotide exchange factor GrpE [Candidatus Phytoplasma pini]|uniref:Protein GrpE n=1 Tax=Candidatus Phytoplasma pini TaxID=267362 RepID=A0A559KJH2_9MOLU|nr:nucleotide exchange factor GrpE [Candidatus Phytoplasma pini]TVY12257.1 chaperone GrpE [Candidatus Phytoplasma pini]
MVVSEKNKIKNAEIIQNKKNDNLENNKLKKDSKKSKYNCEYSGHCEDFDCNKCDCKDCDCLNIEKLKEDNKKLKEDNKKLKEELLAICNIRENDKLKYQADLENFKKRIQKEQITALKYASMDLINDIIIPLEQFDKVLETNIEDNKLLQQFLSGFKMINQQVKDSLTKNGVKEIKALGEKFDPKFHYAVEKIADKEQPNGINVSVLQKGFFYKDLVLKPAMVKINEWSNKNNENK